jgi:hypothetical protein
MRPSFAREFDWDATYRLVLALRQAGFPKPWRKLDTNAQNELIRVIGEWDEKRKEAYPPVVIEAGLERYLEREQEQLGGRFPVQRFKREPELLRSARQRDREYFFGFIRIDRAYIENDAIQAFKNEYRKRWPQIKSGGGTNWRARLQRLAVMRIRKHERDQWKRLKLVAEFCGYNGCRKEVKAYKDRCKNGRGDEPMSPAAKVEMTNARKAALKFFQDLFPYEKKPLNF